jgi:hypothetical protein
VETLALLNRCFSARGILETLEGLPEYVVTPQLAVHALKRIAVLEAELAEVRKMRRDGEQDFLRAALLGQLVDKIQASRVPEILIEGTRVLSENPDLIGIGPLFLRRAVIETLSVGEFDLGQVCEAAKVLLASSNSDSNEVSDLVCEAIMCKANELRPNLVGKVFEVLPLLNAGGGRDRVLAALEKQLGDFFEICGAGDVVCVLRTLAGGHGVKSDRVTDMASRWIAQKLRHPGITEAGKNAGICQTLSLIWVLNELIFLAVIASINCLGGLWVQISMFPFREPPWSGSSSVFPRHINFNYYHKYEKSRMTKSTSAASNVYCEFRSV